LEFKYLRFLNRRREDCTVVSLVELGGAWSKGEKTKRCGEGEEDNKANEQGNGGRRARDLQYETRTEMDVSSFCG